jgi:hypothetical protein
MERKKSESWKKPLAVLLAFTLLVACASFVSSEGNETLNTSLPQGSVTFDPYDPLDALGGGDAEGLGTFLGSDGENAGDENGADDSSDGNKDDGQGAGGADGQNGGEGEEAPDQSVEGADNGATGDGLGLDATDEDSAAGVNYPAALKPPTTSQGAATDPESAAGGAGGTTQGALGGETATSGAAADMDGVIEAAPEIPEADLPIGIGRPPTEGGIFFAPELEPETGGEPNPNAAEEAPTQGAIAEEEVTTPEAIEVTTYAALGTIVIDLSDYGVNGGKRYNSMTLSEQRTLGYRYYYDGNEYACYRLEFNSYANGKQYELTGDAIGMTVIFDGCKDVDVTLNNVHLLPDGPGQSGNSNDPRWYRGSFTLTNGAKVNLYLLGENSIKGCSDADSRDRGSHLAKERIQACAGISVHETSRLEIFGPGKLTAEGGKGAAGIGGDVVTGNSDSRSNCGTVIIWSGDIYAISPALWPPANNPDGLYLRGAAIGGGMFGKNGHVEIRGGWINLVGFQPIGQGYAGGKIINDSNKKTYITSGSFLGEGKARKIQPFDPRPKNQPFDNEDLYMLTVSVVRRASLSDPNPKAVPNAEVEIEVAGKFSNYVYRAKTNEDGVAYCWVPNEDIMIGKIKATLGRLMTVNLQKVDKGSTKAADKGKSNHADERAATLILYGDQPAGVQGKIIYRDHYAKGTPRPMTLGSDIVTAWDGELDLTMPEMLGYYKWGHYLSDGLNQAGVAEDAIERGRANMTLNDKVRYSNLQSGFVLIYEYLDMSMVDLVDVGAPMEMRFWADSTSVIKGVNANGENEYEVQSNPYTFANRAYRPVRVSVISVAAIKYDGLRFTPQAYNEDEIDLSLTMSVGGTLKGGGQIERFDGTMMNNPILLGDLEGFGTTQNSDDRKGIVKIGGTYVGKTLPANVRRPELKFGFRFELAP